MENDQEVWYNPPKNKIELAFKILSVFTIPEDKPRLVLGISNPSQIEYTFDFVKSLVIQGLEGYVKIKLPYKDESLVDDVLMKLSEVATKKPWLLRYIHVDVEV